MISIILFFALIGYCMLRKDEITFMEIRCMVFYTFIILLITFFIGCRTFIKEDFACSYPAQECHFVTHPGYVTIRTPDGDYIASLDILPEDYNKVKKGVVEIRGQHRIYYPSYPTLYKFQMMEKPVYEKCDTVTRIILSKGE